MKPNSASATEASGHRSERRLRALLDVMHAFADATTDYPLLIETVARRMTELIASSCMILMISKDGRVLDPVAVYDEDPQKARELRCVFAAHPLPLDGPGFSASVVRAQKPLILPNVDRAALLASVIPAYRNIVERVDPRSILATPLLVHGEPIGLIHLTRNGPSAIAFDAEDAELAREIGMHAALAIHNARLMVSVQHELRERLRAERESEHLSAQLLRAQRMEAVGKLAGGIAHDFNNLLTVVLAYTGLLSRQIPKSNVEAHHDLEQIEMAGERGADLTRDLLAFSRQQVIDPRVLDVKQIIAETERMLRRLVGENVYVQTHVDPGLWRVRADRGQLSQVLMNLVLNARDAMPDGGTVTIDAQNLAAEDAPTAAGAPAGPCVVISVRDVGHGMDASTQARIFEPFFTTKERGRGTGLGLATVFDIVKQSGGSISVSSEVSVGSTFRTYLPATQEQPVSTPRQSPSPKREGTETVLLVESDLHVRKVVGSILESNGYCVLAAGSPDEALSLVKGVPRSIDLLLTDVVMPGMSGYRLAEEICRARPRTRVLYMSGQTEMSGHTETPTIRERTKCDSVAFLQKPITPEALLRGLRDVLNSVLV